METPRLLHRLKLWNWFVLFIILLMLSAPLLSTATSTSAAMLVLYDGSRNGTPDQQNMQYLTRPIPPAATQSFADGATTLTTTQRTSDIAGYSDNPFLVPALNRAAGFTLRFTVQLLEEHHTRSDKNGDGIGDRAGLSVTLLGSDHKGIELGFWPDQIWAQEDGTAEPPPNTNTLFTHAEGVPFNPTTGLITYALTIQGDTYELASDTKPLLSGRVRDYSAGGQPYTIGNFLFLGDNSGSATGTIKLSAVSLVINIPASATATPVTPQTTLTMPPMSTATPTLTPVAGASPVPTPTPGSPRVLLPFIRRMEQ